MKLAELHPEIVKPRRGDPQDGSVLVLEMDCPCRRGHRIRIFTSTIQDQPVYIDGMGCWSRKGDDLETITIEPSIGTGCWRGCITNGEVV